jgi:hypothetical protein
MVVGPWRLVGVGAESDEMGSGDEAVTSVRRGWMETWSLGEEDDGDSGRGVGAKARGN